MEKVVTVDELMTRGRLLGDPMAEQPVIPKDCSLFAVTKNGVAQERVWDVTDPTGYMHHFGRFCQEITKACISTSLRTKIDLKGG
jgi:hypothetical protein